MKKTFTIFFFVLAGIAVAVLTSCASAPTGTTRSGSYAPIESNQIERIRLDYQGAAIGAAVPEWVTMATEGNVDAFEQLPQFEGKEVFLFMGQGKNLDLLRSQVNNFNIQADVSRNIVNHVEAKFGGILQGDKNTEEAKNFTKEIVASLSNATFSGLSRDMDYWIKLRTIDHGRKTESEGYNYFVVYSMSKDDLQYQIAAAMGRISAETREEEELKSEVEEAMRQLSYNSIITAE